MNNTLYKFILPDLQETRGDVHLLVWGDLGTWIAADEELKQLLLKFDGTKTVETVLNEHAKQQEKPFVSVQKECLSILTELIKHKILDDSNDHLKAVNEEPLSIANVTLNITNNCNLKCSFCYNGTRNRQEADVLKIAEFLRNSKETLSNDSSLIILGGEPLLDPKRLFLFLESVRGIFSRPPMISTNGTKITADIASQLAAANVEVQVSLDSYDPEAHDKSRGHGVFERASKGIEQLVKAGVYTIISMVVTKQTLAHMEGIFHLANSLQVNEARFIPLRNTGAAALNSKILESIPNPMHGFSMLLDILKRYPQYASLLGRDFFSVAAAQCSNCATRISCGIGRRVIFIDADGDLYPCPNHVMPDLNLGNILTSNMKAIMSCLTMQTIRDRYHIDRFVSCNRCAFRRWCAGDCRGEVIATYKNPHAPSPNCSSLKKMYSEMLWCLALNDLRLRHVILPNSTLDFHN